MGDGATLSLSSEKIPLVLIFNKIQMLLILFGIVKSRLTYLELKGGRMAYFSVHNSVSVLCILVEGLCSVL